MKQNKNGNKFIFDDRYEESVDKKNWKSRKSKSRAAEKNKEKQRLRSELKSYE